MTEAYYAPRKPTTLKRQHECLAFAARDHGLRFWSYIARYNDITAYQMKGWPDARPWMDLPEALTDGAATLAWLIEHEAEIRAFLALAPEARAAVLSHGPIVADLAQELAKREAIAKAGGPRR